MIESASSNNARTAPDQVLVDIADYVLDYAIDSERAYENARLCLTDSIACALYALDIPECTRLLGPLVPGTVVPNGARVPGTRFQLDPSTAAFNFGAMIRWSDLNDAFTAASWSHASDNLAGVLMTADYLSRQQAAAGRQPLRMRDVLEALVKAYEIQGCLSLENDCFGNAIDHNVLIRVASTAVLTRMLGGAREQIVDAVSNAWIDTSLVAYRFAPNTGARKNWACADASAQAVRLALMAIRGEKGYPSILTAKKYGFYDARFGGKPFGMTQPYADYVIQNSMFKFVTAGMHSQSAVECAFRLHPLVKDRINDIERIEIHGHGPLIKVMGKTGPLYNPDDRDHCVQYVVAVGLLCGRLGPPELENDFAADPRIDALRAKTVLIEDPRYTRDFYDPAKRSSANAVQAWFKDGTSTPKADEEYPLGHQRRRSEAIPLLRAKFAACVKRRFPPHQCEQILQSCADSSTLDAMPVHRFTDMFDATDR